MKKVFQKRHNDCVTACVASILNKEIHDVPYFYENGSEHFWDKFDQWIQESDLKLSWARTNKWKLPYPHKNKYWIAFVRLLDENEKVINVHSVVCKKGKNGRLYKVHDPSTVKNPHWIKRTEIDSVYTLERKK